MARDKVILAYSGGLDTSVMVPWIGEKYNLDVVTFTVDLGQGEDIEKIRQKALQDRRRGRRRHGRPQPVRRLLRLARPDGRGACTKASIRWPPPWAGRSSPS